MIPLNVDMKSVTDAIDIEPIHFHQVDTHSPDPLHQTDVDFELSVIDIVPPVLAMTAVPFGDDDSLMSQSSETNVQTLFEHNFEDIPDLDSLSIVSLTNTSTASSTNDKEHEFLKRLYLWSTRFSHSQ